MQVSVFYLPSIGARSEIEKGMAGLRGDLYQEMLRELKEQAQLADELGYDSISFTEHHFHVEGFEISNNPVLLDERRFNESAGFGRDADYLPDFLRTEPLHTSEGDQVFDIDDSVIDSFWDFE